MHMHLGRDQLFGGRKWYWAVIPNAFDLKNFIPSSSRGEDFLYLGRLNEDKGVAIAVHAAKEAGRKILIVGQGDPEQFLKGNPHASYSPPVGVEERRALLANAHAVFCPTQFIDPFCGVNVEAQLSGTPVITSDFGVFPETVIHGVTGYRCRTFEQFEWAAKNVGKLDGSACAQWARANYSLERVALMYEEFFQQVLNVRDHGGAKIVGGTGFYEPHPGRSQLDWLNKIYPEAATQVSIDLSRPHEAPASRTDAVTLATTPAPRCFLELGSAYWDTLHEKLGSDPAWCGVTVDARSELLERLPHRANVEKINAVITPDASRKTVPFYYVPADLVVSRGFPQWLDGCGSTRRDHAILALFSDQAVTWRDIRAISLADVLRRLPSSPERVKTDLEGDDAAIVNGLLDLGVCPTLLEFEIVHMTDAAREQLFARLSNAGYRETSRSGDSVIWTMAAKKTLLIYTDTAWALGQLHSGLSNALNALGWHVERQDWSAFAKDATRFDRVLTLPGTGAKALLDVGVARERIVLVAHHEEDIASHLKLGELFQGYAAYGVVSDSLANSSMTLGVPRVPSVVRVGVDVASYSAAPQAKSLQTVGYGSIMERKSSLAGVEMKRGQLARQCAEEAGLAFRSASESSATGQVRFEEMPAFYASVDAVLMPSLMEGAGLPALEAAAAGRLVIGTPVGHFPRLAYEGCGLLAPIDEHKFRRFAVERLSYYRANKTAFMEQCAAGQRAAMERDWSKVALDWHELLQ
jgi:glycosyltransferase involved in cell wall biosynthesis